MKNRRAGERRSHLRRQIAISAARLIVESGIHDPDAARRKAARDLGVSDQHLLLPDPSEIDAAVREHLRLFSGATTAQHLERLRRAALEGMAFFASFHPQLVGAVLDGTASAQSPICLHLHCDDPDDVARFLDQHEIPATAGWRRIRLDRHRGASVPALAFSAGDVPVEVIVLPLSALRQSPLQGIGDATMERATATQLRRLMSADQVRP